MATVKNTSKVIWESEYEYEQNKHSDICQTQKVVCAGFTIRKLTRWTETSIHAVIVTHLASLGVAAGVSTGTTTFFILHVERACCCYSMQKRHNLKTVTLIWIQQKYWNSNVQLLFLQHSCAVFHCCGCPPAWAHWREYSDMVAHKHEVLLLERHRSFIQALVNESISIRFWQLRNAGPDSKFAQRSVCGSKYTSVSIQIVPNIIHGFTWSKSIFTYLICTALRGWRGHCCTLFIGTIILRGLPIVFNSERLPSS